MSDGSGLPAGERITALISAAYGTDLGAEGWSPLADDLRSAFHSDLAIVQYHDHREPERSFVVASGLGHEFLSAYETHSGMATEREDDVLWQAAKVSRPGSVYLNLDLRPLEEERRSELYRLLAEPWDLLYFMSGVAMNSPEASAYVSLGRRTDNGCFTTAERHLLGGSLLGHVGHSMALHRGFASARRQAALYVSVLDAMPDGVIVFDAEGRAILTNRAAASICAGGDALLIRDGRLATPDAGRQALLDRALQAALTAPEQAPPAPVCVTAPGAGGPVFHVTFSRLGTPGTGDDMARALPDGAAILAVICTAGGPQTSALAARYSLTQAEERLCLMLVAGRTLREAGDVLDISRNTAKTHLGRVFDKTGVRSQVALIGLLAPILNKR
jgi:DNA-binding CsgD family transcriptional regulator/PAS domain-containing protein